MENEIWKPVEWRNGYYKGYYEISNLGRVKSVERIVYQNGSERLIKERIKKIHFTKGGYPAVTLCKERKSIVVPIHVLIADAFIPNPDNKPCIDHINTDKSDYRIKNLRWVTQKENCNNPISKDRCRRNSHTEEALSKAKQTKIQRGGKTSPKKVYQFTLDGDFLGEYESAREASRLTGVAPSDIDSVCAGRKTSAGRFLWSRTGTPPAYSPYSKKNKPILQFDPEMNLVKEWPSIKEAANELGLQISNISRVANGQSTRKLCGGFIWEFKDLK